ncbi:MAG: hypothetical protein JWQ76_3004 [Ramlibacter sp.]|nr:hypothetical protein [Ramlibacter sp.]
MKRLVLMAALLACCAPVFAQAPAAGACPQPSEVMQAHMLGLWRAEFEDRGPGATLLLERHPDYAESLSGAVNRGGERRQLAGDVEDGDLTLEESADGVHIAAIWVGELVEGSCGREVRGTWKAEGAAGERYFVLRKQ